jgi:hypothetical protein
MFAKAQSKSQSPDPAPSYLLRMERAAYLESVCVLLNADGRYHLERHQPRKVRVFEGTLREDELRDVIRIVSGKPLFGAEQKDVPELMLKSDDDRVTLAIHRLGAWQQLIFPDSSSREPFREAMVPLLKWFDSINKRKVPEISEEAGRNNCLPPSKTEFSQRNSTPPATDANQPQSAQAAPASNAPRPPENYILHMYESRLFNYEPEVACLLVASSGSYHLVKQTKTPKKGLSNAVLDGTLTPPQLASLRSLLDAPELVNRPEEEEKGELIMASNSSYTRLKIPRNGKIQKIATWKSYRIVNQILSQTPEDHGTSLLVPLREWLKSNVNENSATPTAIPPNPRCEPGR